MKRTITRGLLFIGALLISGISAEAVKIDGINYTIPRYGSKASVGKNSNLEDNIVIKETIESGGKTYTVTSIDKNAFLDCKLMYSITLPKTITKIEQNAFYGCVGLNVGGVHISDLKAWCETKFNGDYSQPLEFANKLYIDGEEVTELVIPDGVEKISDNAFFGCDNITSLTIPSSVKEIGNYAFRDFKKLQSLTIGEGLETIGESAFQNASSLTSLVLPNTTKTLKAYAFSGCNSLQSVTFGNSVETVLESAFSSCTSIKEVNISDIAAWSKINFKRNDSQPLYYAHNLYLNGDAITELEIPEGVETIGTNAFLGLSSINSAIIPNSVKTISTGAFLDCTGLREVTIGESVETIGISSFSGCAGLEELTIPNSTKKISTDAFKNCTGLQTITLGNSLERIERYVFKTCKSLKEINSMNEVPPVLSDAEAGESAFAPEVISTAILYVPKGCMTTYIEALGWKEFKDNIRSKDFSGVAENLSADVKVKAINGEISVTGCEETTIVEVYNTSGQLIHKGASKRINVPSAGIYIVKAAGTTHKLIAF